MGNKNSSGSEPSLSNFTQREEEDPLASVAMPSRGHMFDQLYSVPNFPKRSATMSDRHRISDVYVPEMSIPRSGSDAASHRSSPFHQQPLLPPYHTSSSDATAPSDDIAKHVVSISPDDKSEGVSLGNQIVVTFDKDIKSVLINKLFEVSCDSIEPSMNPIKGQVSYDNRLLRATFTPLNTFLPNAQYTIVLKGRAVTTTLCQQGSNIKDTEFHFQTCNPSPKNIGIKLKGDNDSEELQIASYYDLYNSLILWCTKKWGCSGEHIVSIQSEKEGGKMLLIKGDLDVLNVNENEVIIVDIKD